MDKITELKARAYDLLAALEALQRELQLVNQQIAELNADRNNNNSSS